MGSGVPSAVSLPSKAHWWRSPRSTRSSEVARSRRSLRAAARLTPITDYEDRAEAFNTFVAMLSAAQLFPPTELPETSELIRFELESLGARPMKPATPGGR